jgi:ketosteroid isomerase-like protein
VSDPVTRLFTRFEARDWDGAGAELAEDVVIEWPHSGECMRGREAVVEVNRNYPEPWAIDIRRVVADGARVAAEVAVRHSGGVVYCAGFYEVECEVVARGTEYWLDPLVEEPPAWRAQWVERYEPS